MSTAFEDLILRDTAANRPAAGKPGRLFYDTTNEKWQRDTGATWEDCEPAAAAGSDSFKTIQVSGQSDVVADSATDTLTLAAGSNVTITTNAGTDTITIAASSAGVTGPGSSTDNAIARFDGTGGGTIQNSGVVIDDSDNMVGNQGALYNFKGSINAQTGTTYTTQDSDNGKVITLSNAGSITLTVHQAAAAGFNCLIIQLGAGQVTVAAGGTGNVRNRSGHTKLAGQYAAGSIFIVSNSGTAPEVYLAGDTGV